MGNGSNMPLILGGHFLATAGAVVYMSKGIISFANIYENVFYKIMQQKRGMHLASCIGVIDVHLPTVVFIRMMSNKYWMETLVLNHITQGKG